MSDEKKPKTFEEAVYQLVSEFRESGNDKTFSSWTEHDAVVNTHRLSGMNLRNSWGLWDDRSPLHQDMKSRFGLWHADDMSALIYRCAHRELNGEPWDPGQGADVAKDLAKEFLDEIIAKVKAWWKEHTI